MSLFITTQSYRQDKPTNYGLLLEMDDCNGTIIRQLRVETFVETGNINQRIKPGLRGLFEYKNKFYTTSWNSIFVIDKESFEIEQEISHDWMSDLHGIFVSDEGIWVASSLPDVVILYDFEGNPRSSLWLPETFLYEAKLEVNKTINWRNRGKNFRGFNQYHANHIEVIEELVYITGRGLGTNGRVISIEKKAFLNNEYLGDKDIKLFAKGLHGPHDGIWDSGFFWVTETNGSTIAAIGTNGRVKYRKTILESEHDRIKYDGFIDFAKSKVKRILKKPGKKLTHWTRGLSITQDYIYVGQSTWAGDTESKACIVKIKKQSSKIVDCFFMDIPGYPETRIFQVLASPTC